MSEFYKIAITNTRTMNRLCLLILALFFIQTVAHTQCTPDQSLEDAELGLYPEPFNADTRPNGGITDFACAGQPFEFVFTVVATETFEFGDNSFTLESLILNSVNLLDSDGNAIGLGSIGLSSACSPGNCTVEAGNLGCLVISGTIGADVEPGLYDLTLSGSAVIAGLGPVPASFPDQVNFPGDRYILEVRDSDCTPLDCSLEATIDIDPATCFSSNDGSATVNVTGATGNVTYMWEDGQTTATATGLDQGMIGVTITDESCSIEATANVGAGLGTVEFTVDKDSDAGCGGGGSATVNISEGQEPYTYLWSDNQMTATATDLAAGTYTVTVTDNTGCSNVGMVTIENDGSSVGVMITKTDVICHNESTGSATATVDGGNDGATFMWSTTETTPTITGLSAGMYTVTVTKDGCEIIESVTINEPADITIQIQKTDSDCSGGNNGTAMASAMGGNGGFTYTWTGDRTGESIMDLAPGEYIVTATDSEGCTAEETVMIGGSDMGFVFTVETMDVSCPGDMDGTARLVSDEEPNGVTISWSTGATGVGQITELAPGDYDITVSDGDCEVVRNFTIGEPDAIQIDFTTVDISCDGMTLGRATVTATGGDGNYTFAWSNSGNSSTILDLEEGTYMVTVTDGNGCSETGSVEIVTEELNIMTTIDVTDVNCNGDTTGAVVVDIIGGNTGFDFLWSSGETTNSIQDKAAGIYAVTISMGAGCESVEEVTIVEPTALSVEIQTTTSSSDCSAGVPVSLTAMAQGGTPQYTYQWSTTESGATIMNLESANYTVTVTDANGCTDINSTQVNIEGGGIGFLATADVTEISCNGDTDGAIDISIQGATDIITYEWSIPGVQLGTSSVSALGSGTYMVTVTSGECSDTVSVTLTDPPALTFTTQVSDVSCNSDTDGSFQVTPNGGTAPYSFSWQAFPGESGGSFDGLAAGTYSFILTDANGCPTEGMVMVTEPEAIEIDIQSLGAGCSMMLPTEVIASATGGSGNFSYAWSDSSMSDTLSNPPMGTYMVTVTDGATCVDSIEVVVDNREVPLELEITKTDVDCLTDDGNDGTASVMVSGGSGGNYNFMWSNGETTEMITDLTEGTYEVTVTDVTGCRDSIAIDISDPGPFDVTLSVSSPLACAGDEDALITAVTSRGTPNNFDYVWSNGVEDAAVLSNVGQGTYMVSVTEVETGCTIIESITVTEPDSIDIRLSSIMDVDCGGDLTGSIEVIIEGGSGILTYDWSGESIMGVFTQNLTQVSGGDYTLVVTDQSGCQSSRTFTVGQPEPLITNLTVFNESGNSDGSATTMVTGGTPPYSYDWTNLNGSSAGDGESLDGLSGGDYILIVTDANGCTVTESFTIQSSDCFGRLNLEFISEATDCENAVGRVGVTATNGIAPYTYLWSTGDTTQVVDSLPAGNYFVTVTDSERCPSTGSVEVDSPSDFIILFADREPISCAGDSDAALTAMPSGRGPFSYNWGGPSIIGSVTDQTVTGLAAGVYTVSVTNGEGCLATRTVEISEPDTLRAEIASRMNVSCPGMQDGSTSILATGGTAPYSYVWSNTSSEEVGTTDTLSNLAAGTYLVSVTDANGCSVQTSIDIGESQAMEITLMSNGVRCNGGMNGSAGVNVAGGQAPYTYLWSNGETSQGVTNLSSGMQSMTVTDANGCTMVETFNIPSPPPIVVSISDVTNETQDGNEDGSATANAEGGNPPYRYDWENGEDTQTAVELAPGINEVTVTDANGCTGIAEVNINESNCALTVNVRGENISCNGETDGLASAEVTGSGEDLTYEWSDGLGDQPNISGLSAGNYTVTVSDASGCIVIESVNIEEPLEIRIEIDDVVGIDCEGNGGAARARAQGGTGNLSYEWSSGATTLTASNLVMGENSVTVTDENGCTAVETVMINPDAGDALTFDNNITDVPCVGEMTGAATINVDQAGNYTYDWPGDIPDEQTVTGLPAGQYDVTVTNESGCSSTTRVRIDEPDGAPLDVLVTIGQPIACFGDDSAILLTEIQGGTSDYRFEWSDSSTEERLVGVGEGTYSVTVTDMNGCVAESNEVEIIEPDSELVVEANSTNETAADTDDGAARIDIEGGVEPYEVEWSHGPTTRIVVDLEPGEYTWTVTDANGCVVEGIVIIEEAASCVPFAVEINTTNASCSTNADGRAEVTSAAGVEPFIYEWSNGSTETSVDSLEAGTYSVTITDSESCPVIQEFTIDTDSIDLNLTVLDVDCEGSGNGNATLEPTGGTMPYTYAWSIDSLTLETADSLDVGEYSVTVTDANGCVEMASFTIEIGEDRTPPTIIARNHRVYLDEFGEAGFHIADIDDGTMDNCGMDTIMVDRDSFTCENLGVNEILFSAVDESGNMSSMIVEVTVLDTLAPFLDCLMQDTLIEDCLADRTIVFEMPQVLDNCGQSLTPTLISGLESGSIFPAGQTEQVFEVIDSSGNAATCSFIVDVDVLGVTIDAREPTCFGFADGTLKASTINTTGEVFYSWNNGGDVDSLGGLSAGEYTVTIIDASGCSSVETVELTQPDLLTADIDLINGSSENAAEGAIFVTVEGGVPPYSYQWTIDGTQIITGQGDPDLENIRRGDYLLTVFDQNGCIVNTDEIQLRGDTIVDNSNTYITYEVDIYPNPTSGEVFFQIEQNKVRAYSVSLYGITGRLIRNLATEELNRSERIFDLSAYDDGMYFLRVQVEDQVLTKRIVLLKE